MIFQIPHCRSVPGIRNVGLDLEFGLNLEWDRGILRVSFPRTGRRFRVASGPPYADHRVRTRRTDGPVEMT